MFDNEIVEQLLNGFSKQNSPENGKEIKSCLQTQQEPELAEMEYCLRELETLAYRMRKCFLENPMGLDKLVSGIENINTKYANQHYAFELNLWDIDVSASDDMLEIQIPELLPHRKSKPETIFVYTLRQRLYEFAIEDPKRFISLKENWKNGAILVVEHSYRSQAMVRDTDNVELKQVIDLLHFLGYVDSDRAINLSLYLTFNPNKTENHTHLYLTSKEKMHKFWR